MAKVRKQLDQRRRKRIHRPIAIHASFTIPRQLVQSSLTVSEEAVLPSQDLYNKNLILTKVQEINKDRVGIESLELSSKEETPETNFHDKMKKD
ncbi:MAG: hypothetical protein IPH52_18820 [Leptospiraceae bacterium]|nr:hypothetical protein [Leptospiraceae bacterium]